MGKIFIIVGKSATGKDTIYQEILKREGGRLKQVVMYTTRPIRDGEMEGVEYHFVDEAGYQKLKEEDLVIEERAYDTVYGIWRYFTVNDDQLKDEKANYLMLGTLESVLKMQEYFGVERIHPIYIDVETGTRLERALKREKKQTEPKYTELCRRFLADEEDFSPAKIQNAGINKRYENEELESCIEEIRGDLHRIIKA